jgi:release factor glutamine methyltransferase
MRDPAPLALPEVVARLRAVGCVFAEEEAALLIAAATPDGLAAMVDRRAAGEPLEYVIGWAEFCGLRVAVEPGVFVPRHRTEFLASQAAAHAHPGAVVVDLCCGSGAVGAAVVAALPSVELHATEIDATAARCARRNLVTVGGQVHAGDLYDPLPAGLRGRVDVLVANVPYVPTDEIPLLPREARLY